ncbi:MAG: T9SS type A sorting domain-containing protein [Bacteroidetes bacterium]|nr:T9SS type A sorting domain-containing protein [Bacteroidota bacterium]
MKSIRIITVLFLFASQCFPQTGWYQVSSGTNNLLKSVCFANANTGFAVGDGVVIKSTNAGESWSSIPFPNLAMMMRNIYFKNQLTGYILGNHYVIPNTNDSFYTTIFKTTDGGSSWFIDIPRMTNVMMREMEFLDDNTGYMTGTLYVYGGPNKVFKTINGGANWVQVPFIETEAALTQKFINSETGFVSSLNKIYKTTNSGTNWNIVYTNNPSDFNCVHSISFINSNTGFACGGMSTITLSPYRFIIKTTDGGNNWQYVMNDSSNSMLGSITAVNENNIFACGSVCFDGPITGSGKILKSTNAGVTWIEETLPLDKALSKVITKNNLGFAVGADGLIYKNGDAVSVTQTGSSIPSSIKLHQNYPNPFNPSTTINFDIPKQSFVSLKVFDMTGKEVQNLFEGVKQAGSYQVKFDGVNLNSGVYFYKLMTDGASITKSMVLVK